MAATVEWHPAAEREYNRHAAYYIEEAGKEVAFRFVQSVRATLREITEAPDRWRKIDGTRRACAVSGAFPFRLVYRVLDNGVVRILAVEHGRRDQPWRERE